MSEISGDVGIRIHQIHRNCLNCIYATEFYKAIYRNQSKYSRHFDFAIGLGTAISGGSGLGILKYDLFAWPCGIVTALSLILTVAKSAYDWPGKSKEAVAMIEGYGRLSGKYISLIDDMNFRRGWIVDFEERFAKLKEEESSFPSYVPDMPIDMQRSIQNDIKKRIDYRNEWWKPAA